jgi:hypothetical protein
MVTKTNAAPHAAAATELRRCIGSTRFGIEAHEAPIADFPKQHSRKDGLGLMCAVHWKAYVKGLSADRKARAASGMSTPTSAVDAAIAGDATKAATKRERRRTPMASKPEPARVRKARATLTATERLGGPAYTQAIGTDEVQAALETVNGRGTSGPDDAQLLVAGVLYDAETLEEEVGTTLGESLEGGTEEADAA